LTNICHATIFNNHSKLTECFFLLLTVCFFISPAQGYSGGSGTSEDPYRITTVTDWQALMTASADWNKHFILAANIDLQNVALTSVGNSSIYFTGVFDGNGLIIRNAVINTPGNSYVGLFGYVGSGGQIRNLGLESINIAGFNEVGGLIGHNGGTVSNCYAKGTVAGYVYAGGLVGSDVSGPISNCHAICDVSGNFYVGGLVGQVVSENVYDSYSGGSVSGINAVGGLAGGADPVNCYSTSTVSGVTGVGGLVGYGLPVGCYSAGSVSGNTIVGGLVGSEGAVNSYSLSSVSGDDRVGGLIGENWTSVTNCYSAGYVSGTTNVGGLVGYNNSGSVSSSFWDTQTSSRNNSDGGVGRTTDQMRMVSIFDSVGWDFTTPLWAICEGANYPRLAWEQRQAADFVCPDGVAMTDFAFLAAHWLQDNCEELNGYCEGCDLNQSGAVDFTDLRLFVDQWLTGIR
jgi:hypothetical protein